MRISWLAPDTIEKTRAFLVAWNSDWPAHFSPQFRPPPAPPGVSADTWPKIAEHVARALRVGHAIRTHGLEAAISTYQESPHAVELATLIGAAIHAQSVPPHLVISVLHCEIDDLVVYGPSLQLVEQIADQQREPALRAYETFCAALRDHRSDHHAWAERVQAVRDGLAGFYIRCGRLDAGDEIFRERHQQETDNILVALAASRCFLAAGAVERAIDWLERGAERADELDRPAAAAKLRAQRARIMARQA